MQMEIFFHSFFAPVLPHILRHVQGPCETTCEKFHALSMSMDSPPLLKLFLMPHGYVIALYSQNELCPTPPFRNV